MLTDASPGNDIAVDSTNQWHDVAAVFKVTSYSDVTLRVTGDFTFYFDDTSTPAATATDVTISTFGDSLDRTIGVGMHPEGFPGDFFDGLIYSPRVTLGALHPAQLLSHSDIAIVTTLLDKNDDPITPGACLSLREAVNHSPANTLIVSEMGKPSRSPTAASCSSTSP